MSQTLVVSFDKISNPMIDLPSVAVLKLYDRRFIQNPRQDYGDGTPYNYEKEQAFQHFIMEGRKPLRPYVDTVSGKLDAGSLEAFCSELCRTAYNAEKRAYELLQNLQGHHIPKFYGSSSLSYHSTAFPGSIMSEVPGLLLEFIDGCSPPTCVQP